MEQDRREEESEFAQEKRPWSGTISAPELSPQPKGKALPQACAAPPLSVTDEEQLAYEAKIKAALIIERKILIFGNL